MINKNEAERLAAAANALRPDWPIASLMTLLAELRDWPLRDLGTALTWIALDQDMQGNWTSQTPARIKEDGPWRSEMDDAAALARARYRGEAERQQRLGEISARTRAVNACDICDSRGRLPGGILCHHDADMAERAKLAAERREYASQFIRPTIPTREDDQQTTRRSA